MAKEKSFEINICGETTNGKWKGKLKKGMSSYFTFGKISKKRIIKVLKKEIKELKKSKLKYL